jgi:hypothetical protein
LIVVVALQSAALPMDKSNRDAI